MSDKRWENKIVGHDEVPPDQLLAHPDNWRIHPQYQQKALRGVINDIGFIKSVTVNRRTGRVVDGHLRVTLALRDGIETIPVEYVELTEAEEAEALLTLDPIAALAGSDKDNLQTLMGLVESGDADVLEFLNSVSGQNEDSAYSPNVAPIFSTARVMDEDVVKEKARLDNRFKENDEYLEVICPHCANEFFINKKDVK